MRKAIAALFGLLGAMTSALFIACAIALPASVREWQDSPKDIAWMVGGTAWLLILAIIWFRGCCLGINFARPRRLLDYSAQASLVAQAVVFLILQARGVFHMGVGYWVLGISIATLLAFRTVAIMPEHPI